MKTLNANRSTEKDASVVPKRILRNEASSSKGNAENYQTKAIVDFYAKDTSLQIPEQLILDRMRENLGDRDMLDLGVGAGRTAAHFAPLAKSYVGLDYSEGMIKVCQERFRGAGDHITFEHGDVRDMSQFENHQFDWVFFSFNGIDYITHEERLQALAEIKRVLRPDGFFVFATHNLQVLNAKWEFATPLRSLKKFLFLRELKQLNPSFRKPAQNGHAVLLERDQSHVMRIYYIKPCDQILQLKQAGFQDVKVHPLFRSDVLTGQDHLESLTDPWLYYGCKKAK